MLLFNVLTDYFKIYLVVTILFYFHFFKSTVFFFPVLRSFFFKSHLPKIQLFNMLTNGGKNLYNILITVIQSLGNFFFKIYICFLRSRTSFFSNIKLFLVERSCLSSNTFPLTFVMVKWWGKIIFAQLQVISHYIFILIA